MFAAIADLPGFRFAAIADTKSGLTTGVRAANAIPAAEQLAFTKAVTLIQEWLSLGSAEIFSDTSKTIDSLIISQEKVCRIGYALGTNSTLALVFELEREQTNIALTQMLLEDLKTELQRD